MTPDHVSAADGLAIAMLLMIAVSLGMVAALFLSIRSSASRRDHQVDELLEEVAKEEEQGKLPSPPEQAPRTPWEKDEDWWKK
jgi:hypothetical protein